MAKLVKDIPKIKLYCGYGPKEEQLKTCKYAWFDKYVDF